MAPKSFKAFMSAMGNNSFKDMDSMARYVQRNAPQELLSRTIPGCFDVLTTLRLPSLLTTSESLHTIRTVLSAVVILDQCGRSSTSPKLAAHFVHGWRDLHAWITFLFESIYHVGCDGVEKRLAMMAMMNIIQLYQSREDLRSCLLSTPTLLPTIVRLWIDQGLTVGVVERSGSHLPNALSSLQDVLEGDATGFRQVVEEMLLQLSGDRATLCEVALRHLQISSAQDQIVDENWRDTHLAILCIRRLVDTQGYRTLMLEKHAVATMTRTLAAFGVLPSSIDSATVEGVITCIVESLYFIVENLDMHTQSVVTVRECLEAGFFIALLQCQQWFYRLPSASLRNNIPDFQAFTVIKFIPYLRYPSLLTMISRSIKKIDRHYIERLLRAEDPLLRAWLQFKEVALERIELKKEVEKECECSNPECTVKGPRKHFRECAGCEGALYCSRGCQSRDWKEGNHRSACKLIDRDTARDTKFIHAMMKRGLPQVADKLCAQKRASFPDTPWSSLWIDCNCMGSEPEYRVQRHLTPAAVALPRAEEIDHDIEGEPVKVAISTWHGNGMFRLMTMVGLASIEAELPLDPGDEFVHRIDTHRD